MFSNLISSVVTIDRWEDNIKMSLHKVGWGSMEWIAVAQNRDRCLGARGCANEITSSLKFGEFLD